MMRYDGSDELLEAAWADLDAEQRRGLIGLQLELRLLSHYLERDTMYPDVELQLVKEGICRVLVDAVRAGLLKEVEDDTGE